MSLFDTILALLKQNESFAVATIVNRSGSAPRDVGTRMLIRKDGAIIGTIGGGILEAQVQKLAAGVLSDHTPVIENFEINTEDISSMGMICGGGVRVMIQYVDASNPYELRFYQTLAQVRKDRTRAWMVTPLPHKAPASPFLISPDGPIIIPPQAEPFSAVEPKENRPTVIDHMGIELLIEPLNRTGMTYIFGAGHISQNLAPLTQMMGFTTIVLDDRREFANRARFTTADEIKVLRNFDSALEDLDIDDDSYIVIVSRGHIHDKTILAQALKSNAGYIGMIGSRHKRKDIYTALMAEGFKETDFKRVFSPIGLNIGAETPEEIALSIVAELVQQRAHKRISNDGK